MRIGSLLLTADDVYVKDGRLPIRPDHDKEWLKYLCKRGKVIASPNTIKDLPDWIEYGKPWDLNLGIKTLYTDPPDILLISRSIDKMDGKKFDLSKWEKVEVEVWKLKT